MWLSPSLHCSLAAPPSVPPPYRHTVPLAALALIWTPRSTAVAGRAHPQLQRPLNAMPSFRPLSPWQPRGLSGLRASPKYRPGPSLVPACSSPGVHAFSDLSQVTEEVSPPPASPPRLTYPNLPGPHYCLCALSAAFPAFSRRVLFSFLICVLPP